MGVNLMVVGDVGLGVCEPVMTEHCRVELPLFFHYGGQFFRVQTAFPAEVETDIEKVACVLVFYILFFGVVFE